MALRALTAACAGLQSIFPVVAPLRPGYAVFAATVCMSA